MVANRVSASNQLGLVLDPSTKQRAFRNGRDRSCMRSSHRPVVLTSDPDRACLRISPDLIRNA